MARDIARDYREITGFAAGYIGRRAVDCIDAYAAKRRMASYRAGRAFWDKVDDGEIVTENRGGIEYIKNIKEDDHD